MTGIDIAKPDEARNSQVGSNSFERQQDISVMRSPGARLKRRLLKRRRLKRNPSKGAAGDFIEGIIVVRTRDAKRARI